MKPWEWVNWVSLEKRSGVVPKTTVLLCRCVSIKIKVSLMTVSLMNAIQWKNWKNHCILMILKNWRCNRHLNFFHILHSQLFKIIFIEWGFINIFISQNFLNSYISNLHEMRLHCVLLFDRLFGYGLVCRLVLQKDHKGLKDHRNTVKFC